MGRIIAIVVLSLATTVVTVAELGQPVKANTLRLPALSIGDRVIAGFVVVTFAVAFVNGVMLLADKILQ